MAFRRVTNALMPGVFANNKGSENEAPVSHINQKSMFSQPKRAALGDIGNTKLASNNNKLGFKKEAAAALRPRKPLASTMNTSTTNTRKSMKRALAPSIKHVLDDAEPMDVQEDLNLAQAPASCPLPPGVEDIDSADIGSPQLVAEYVTEIYAYMRELEVRHAVTGDYLAASQPHVTPDMRGILINWLVDVHNRFKLLQETMFLTCDIMDRFLSKHPGVSREKLQLVGLASMLIACKYEEMYPPEVNDFVFISDSAYSRDQFLKTEALILRVLDFDLGTPLPIHFLRRYSKASQADGLVHVMAKYFMELKQCNYGMVTVHPSQTAAAAIFLSREIILPEQENWNATLQHYSGYSQTELLPVINALRQTILQAAMSNEHYQATVRKYSSHKLWKISSLPALHAWLRAQQ